MALRVGFVGLGNIGRPIAERLLAAGLDTTVYDVAEAPPRELAARGAKLAPSPRELARACDVIGVCVRDDDDVRAVCLGGDGLLAGAAAGAVVAIHSTVLPATVLEVGEAAAVRGVGVLDACVTGGAARAQQGKLTYMVGGDAAHLERARPVLEASAAQILATGPLGSGCKTKLCLNVITYLQWTAAYESMLLARAIGLPQEVLEQVGRANGNLTDLMLQFLAIYKAPEEARRSEGFQAVMRGHVQVAEKDLAWSLALARAHGVALPGAALCSQIMARVYALEDPNRR